MGDELPRLPGEDPDGDGAPPPGGGPGADAVRWAVIGGLAVLVVALVVALIVVLASGDGGGEGSAQAASPGPRAGAADPEYVSAVRPIVGRLSDSAEVSGRTLSAAARPRDIARVARMARQQLALVQESRSRLSSVAVTPAGRVAAGHLTRATQAHRRYLITLSRIAQIGTGRALTSLATAQRQGRDAVDSYRAYGRLAPGSTGRIIAAELTDLSGVREALRAQRDAERRRAERARRESAPSAAPPAAPAPAAPSGDPSSGRPVISSLSAVDAGSTIDVRAAYCDRTPGAVNQFVYIFRIIDGGTIIASDSYSAAQTRACNSISWSFSDVFAIRGGYTVEVVIDNLTNNVSGSSSTGLVVVN